MLTSQELNILARTPLFSGFDPSTLSSLLDAVGYTRREAERGEVIFTTDRFDRQLGILLSGRVRVTKCELVVSELTEGDLFGAAALFNDEESYVSTLTARSKCEMLFLTQNAVESLMDHDVSIRNNYIRYLSCRIRFLSGKVDALALTSCEKKLSSDLLLRMDENGRVAPDCSMTELAKRLNMGRASLYRDLAKLEEMGVLARDGKTIVVKHPDILARI